MNDSATEQRGSPRALGAAADRHGPRDVVIIGAGPAGLAVAACLTRRGVDHVVLEKAHVVGASWRQHYRRLHLHTVKRHSGLPHLPLPAANPLFPSRDDVIAYLHQYAAHFDVRPRFGVTVSSVERSAGRWHIETDAGRWTARCLVMATGFNRVPVRPRFAGLDTFDGPVLHSSQYTDGVPFEGQDVLVIGCGNSGAEIAVDLHEHGARSALVVRSPVHVAKRTFLGLHAQESAIRLARLPNALADVIMRTASRLGLGDLRPYGLVPPKMGPMTQIKTRGRIPIIDVGLVPLVKAGHIDVVPGIERFGPRSVTLVDGRTRPVDAVVMATGYGTGLQRLFAEPDAYLNETGRPRAFGAEVADAGVFFLGFANPPTGALREISREAPRITDRITALLGEAPAQDDLAGGTPRAPRRPLLVTAPFPEHTPHEETGAPR